MKSECLVKCLSIGIGYNSYVSWVPGKKYIYDRIDRVTEELKKDENIPGLSASLVKQKALSHEEIYASLVDLMGAAVDTVSGKGAKMSFIITNKIWLLIKNAIHVGQFQHRFIM